MAELSEGDFKKINEALRDSTKEVQDFHDKLTDVFDISKKISDQYKNKVQRIRDVNVALDKTRKAISEHRTAIEANNAKYRQIGQQIERNWQESRQYLEEERGLNEQIGKIKEDIQRIEFNRTKTLGTIKRVDNDLVKNAQEKLALEAKQVENAARQLDLTTQIATLEDTAKKSGESSAHFHEMLNEKKQQLIKAQKQGNVLTMKNMQLELQHGELIGEKAKLNERQVEQFKHLVMLNNNVAGIEGNINELQQKRNKLNNYNLALEQQRGNIQAENSKHQASINILQERENKLLSIKAKLYAQLNLYKLVTLAFERFVALDKAAEQFRRTTGFAASQMATIRKYAEQINVQFADMGVTIEQAYNSAVALAGVFNRTSLISKEAMQNVSLLSQNLGVSEEVSAGVLENFMGIGKSSESAAFDTIKLGAALSEKTGVSFAQVMGDISKASETTINMIGASPNKLMKAAIAARALGLDINKIASSQRKLLDFTSSINDELELSALIGKSITFQRARQLAYEGKSDEALKETLKTVKAAGDFEKMNVYQREQLAKAAGMELKDLSKALAVEKQRDDILYGADEEKAKQLLQQEAALENMKKMSEQDDKDLVKQKQKELMQMKMQGAMTKLKNLMDSLTVAFADILEPVITPLMEVVIPLFKVLAAFLKVTVIPLLKLIAYPVVTVAQYLKEWVSGFEKADDGASKVKDTIKAFFDFFDTGIGKVLRFAAGGALLYGVLFGKLGPSTLLKMLRAPFNLIGDLATKAISKVPVLNKLMPASGKLFGKGKAGIDEIGKSAESTKSTPSGDGVKKFLRNLASGLKEMGNAKVLFGAANLIPASIGLVAMIPGAIGAKLFEKIDGKSLSKSLEGLATGLGKMGTAKVLFGSANLIVAAAGLIAMIPGVVGAAILGMVGKPIEMGLNFLAKGIGYMANPKVMLGAVGIALIGASLLPFAFAMKMFGSVDWAAVGIGSLALVGFTAAAFGLGTILASGIGAAIFGAGVIGIAALGAALIPFGIAAIAAGVGIKLLGEGIAGAVEPIMRLSEIDLTRTALGIGAVGVALAAFGAGSAASGLGSFVGKFLGGDPISKMEKLASMGEQLNVTASAIEKLSNSFSQFNAVDEFSKSIGTLTNSLEKMNEQLDKVSVLKLAAITAMTAVGSATGGGGGAAGGGDSKIIEKLDAIYEGLVGGKVAVYMDGTKVSKAIAQNT